MTVSTDEIHVQFFGNKYTRNHEIIKSCSRSHVDLLGQNIFTYVQPVKYSHAQAYIVLTQ